MTGDHDVDTSRVTDAATLERFLNTLEVRLRALSVRTALAWWAKYTGQSGEDVNDLEKERSEIMLNPGYRTVVEEWRARPEELVSAEGRLTARKLDVLWSSMMLAGVNSVPEVFTLQNRVMSRVIAYRPVVGGREVSNAERTRIVRQEADRARRREAWMAVSPLSREVAADTAELLSRRNDLARRAGYRTYVDLVLAASSLTREEVEAVLDGLEENSAGIWRSFLEAAAAREGLDRVEPWDPAYLAERAGDIPVEHFPRERIIPALEATLRSFGRDPAGLGIRIVYHDIPFGGICGSVDPPGDVRIIANPRNGHEYYHTLFHEYGHALHAVYAGDNPHLLQKEPGVFSEGMAEVWGWLTHHPEWLSGLGLDPAVSERIPRGYRLRMLFRHRSHAALSRWEYRAYDDPGQDLVALQAAMEARYLTCESREAHRWAGTPFPSNYPVYWQNYILADLIAAATHEALTRRFGAGRVIGNPEVFEALVDGYWRPGAGRPWRDKLACFTGRGLEAAALSYDWRQA